jgi:hypothetical protein
MGHHRKRQSQNRLGALRVAHPPSGATACWLPRKKCSRKTSRDGFSDSKARPHATLLRLRRAAGRSEGLLVRRTPRSPPPRRRTEPSLPGTARTLPIATLSLSIPGSRPKTRPQKPRTQIGQNRRRVTHRLRETRAQTVGHPGIKALPPAYCSESGRCISGANSGEWYPSRAPELSTKHD